VNRPYQAEACRIEPSSDGATLNGRGGEWLRRTALLPASGGLRDRPQRLDVRDCESLAVLASHAMIKRINHMR